VALIAFRDASLYYNGILSYIIDNKLYILNIYKSIKCKFIVNILKLLFIALFKFSIIKES
jgi:hypothetical protein